jgi:hypothetical protein
MDSLSQFRLSIQKAQGIQQEPDWNRSHDLYILLRDEEKLYFDIFMDILRKIGWHASIELLISLLEEFLDEVTNGYHSHNKQNTTFRNAIKTAKLYLETPSKAMGISLMGDTRPGTEEFVSAVLNAGFAIVLVGRGSLEWVEKCTIGIMTIVEAWANYAWDQDRPGEYMVWLESPCTARAFVHEYFTNPARLSMFYGKLAEVADRIEPLFNAV